MLEIPELVPTMPQPMRYDYSGVAVWRHNERSHFRVMYRAPRSLPLYKRQTVIIPVTKRDFEPYVVHWQRMGDVVRMVDHHAPHKKVDLWMNRRGRDVKDRDRSADDDSRIGWSRMVDWRSAEQRIAMFGAFETDDPQVVADTE